MTRARFAVAATLAAVCASADAAWAQATQAPPLTPILAGKKLVTPVRGVADVEFTQPVTRREKGLVVTRIQLKNISSAPIARLTIDETWYDKGGAVVAAGRGLINGLLQPNEIQTVSIETPYNAKMLSNNWNFTHANGEVKPHKVSKLIPPEAKDADAKPGAAPVKK